MTSDPVTGPHEIISYGGHGVACYVCGYPVVQFAHYRNARVGAVVAHHDGGKKCVISRVRPQTVQTSGLATTETRELPQTMDEAERTSPWNLRIGA